MQYPLLHTPGRVPWKEWDLKSGRKGGSGWIETARTQRGLDVVEAVSAHITDFPIYEDYNADRERGWDLLPIFYGDTVAQDQNMIPTLNGVKIRPNIVRWRWSDKNRVAWGSHQEQELRRTLHGTDEDFVEMERADRKAKDLLYEFLTPQQRLDYEKNSAILVRGKLNKLYRVFDLGGAAIVNTHPCKVNGVKAIRLKVLAAICYHPDVWMPGADVVLSTKLLIENDEPAFLSSANIVGFKTPYLIS